MQNPKTSWAGYLTLAATILNFIAHLLSGSSVMDPTLLATTAAGVTTGAGLVAAADGGH